MKHFIFLAAAAMMLAVACNTNTSAPAADQTTPATTMLTPTTPNPENAAIAQEFSAEIIDGKLYIQTGKVKNVYKQLLANPKAEICGYSGMEWIRIACELIPDDTVEAKKAMLDKNPSLRGMYSETDDNTIVLYCRNAHATISSFTGEPRSFEF